MRTPLILFFFLFFNIIVCGQTDIKPSCLERIILSSKDVKFPPALLPIGIMGDTIEFKRSKIIITNSSRECIRIVEKGIIFPNLVMAANTSGAVRFEIPGVDIIETLYIDSFIKSSIKYSSNIRTYSFLVYKKGYANPYQYFLQLINNNKNVKKMTDQEFVDGSQILAFGFCTILI
jgi:hypothetical protein